MCVLIALRGSQNSSVTLSQVMNHGFWRMTQRQNAKVGSGTLQTLPVPMLIFFLTLRGSSTRNLCHQDQLSIKLFIGKSLKDSGKGWHMCDQALHVLGCCTTTMPHVTQQSPSTNFWQKKAFLWFLSPPYLPDLSPCDFFLFPRLKNHLKGRHFGKKSVPLQAWSGPQGSRKLMLPDFMTTAQEGGKFVSLTHRPHLPPGNLPGTHFC